MSSVGPVDHIARTPLPWRAEPHLTECGKNVADLAGRIVAREEIERRIRAVGQKRAAYETCMTCAETSDRYARRGSGEDAGIVALGREIGAVEYARPPVEPYTAHTTVHTPGGSFVQQRRIEPLQRSRVLWDRRERLARELEAIAALVEAHREEFDSYLTGLDDTVKLSERRATKRAKRRAR